MNGRESCPSLEVSRRGGSLVVTASGTWSLRASASRAKSMQKAGDSVFAALSSPESGIPLQKLELRAENLEAWDSSLLALFAEFSGRAEQAGLETGLYLSAGGNGRVAGSGRSQKEKTSGDSGRREKKRR